MAGLRREEVARLAGVSMMDRLADVPVLVTTVAREIVAANTIATAFSGHAKQKRLNHPEVGELTLDCDDLTIHGSDLNLVVFTAAPGSTSAQALELLGTIGLQRFN